MRREILVSTLALLVTASPLVALAEDFQAAYERIQTQQHLTMIEKGIGTNNARTIAMLGYMTYAHRACGDAVVTEEDVEKIWNYMKMGPAVDDATRKTETSIFADELEKAVTGLSVFDKQSFCTETAKSVLALKADKGLN